MADDPTTAVVDAAIGYIDQLCSFNDVQHEAVRAARAKLSRVVGDYHNRPRDPDDPVVLLEEVIDRIGVHRQDLIDQGRVFLHALRRATKVDDALDEIEEHGQEADLVGAYRQGEGLMTTDPVTTLLYILARDLVPPDGERDTADEVEEAIRSMFARRSARWVLSDRELGERARDWSILLKRADYRRSVTSGTVVQEEVEKFDGRVRDLETGLDDLHRLFGRLHRQVNDPMAVRVALEVNRRLDAIESYQKTLGERVDQLMGTRRMVDVEDERD